MPYEVDYLTDWQDEATQCKNCKNFKTDGNRAACVPTHKSFEESLALYGECVPNGHCNFFEAKINTKKMVMIACLAAVVILVAIGGYTWLYNPSEVLYNSNEAKANLITNSVVNHQDDINSDAGHILSVESATKRGMVIVRAVDSKAKVPIPGLVTVVAYSSGTQCCTNSDGEMEVPLNSGKTYFPQQQFYKVSETFYPIDYKGRVAIIYLDRRD